MEDSSAQWPRVFESLKSRLGEKGPNIILAESWEEQKEAGLCARTLTCGLVREAEYEEITGEQELGHEVDATGPYPNPGIDEYIPRFWIFGTTAVPDDIEPLALSWTSNNLKVQQPEPELLMTYGLIPRIVNDGVNDVTIHWDEPRGPTHDVLIVKPVSVYDYFNQTPSSVLIRREYLQDYASLRQRSVVCVFYERWIVYNDQQAQELLGDDRHWGCRFRDAYIRIQTSPDEDSKFHIEIWGHRLLLHPGPLPVSEDANRYGELNWPGVSGTIDDLNWRRQGMTYVYVKDDALGRFEGNSVYKINPERGSVSYGGQWAVSLCDRVGRDFIRLEVKKLYESNPPDIVRHYHRHAVAPPTGAFDELRQVRNIGIRARDVVYSLAKLGGATAEMATRLLSREITSVNIVSLDQRWIDDHGWWNTAAVEPICRHVPISATRDAFLSRCKDLYRLIGEGLMETNLRKILIGLGVEESNVRDFRSLKCLCRLVELGLIARNAGLDLVTDRSAVVERFTEPNDPSPCRQLFALNDLRLLDAHRPGLSFQEKLEAGLRTFGVDPASTASGYGSAIDDLYDKLASELSDCAEAFGAA